MHAEGERLLSASLLTLYDKNQSARKERYVER
jgi:hypothetical protein